MSMSQRRCRRASRVVVKVSHWPGETEVVSEPCWDAVIDVADGVGDGPVEFPPLEWGHWWSSSWRRSVCRRLLPWAPRRSMIEVGRDDVVEVADGLGVGCEDREQPTRWVFAADLGSGEGGAPGA